MHRWIDLDGLANLRDCGGLPTEDGQLVQPGRLLRSDNLQTLTESDITRLLDLGLTVVVDLRSGYEVRAEGPGPLVGRPDITIHQHSFFREWQPGVGEDKPDVRPEALPDEALPWSELQPDLDLGDPVSSVYFAYLVDRPDSILAGLRHIAAAEGATLVHCAAGKDRTGTLIALALSVIGVEREEVIADYAASTDRVEQVVARLRSSTTYAENLQGRPMESHHSRPEAMRIFLDHIDATYGGVLPLLERLGWTDADTQRLRDKLLR